MTPITTQAQHATAGITRYVLAGAVFRANDCLTSIRAFINDADPENPFTQTASCHAESLSAIIADLDGEIIRIEEARDKWRAA